MTKEELLNKAKEARKYSYAPISNYQVGAALLTKDGKIFTGCNVEDKSGIGITNCCAERTAIIKAVSEGYTEFESIAVVGGLKNYDLEFVTPCGVCRQYMYNFNKNLKIISEREDKIETHILKDLLPFAFDETFESTK